MLSSKSFMLSALTSRPVIYLSSFLFCMWCEVEVQLHSFAYVYQLSQCQLLKDLYSSPLNCFGNLVKNQLMVNVFISVYSTLFHLPIYLSLCQFHIVIITVILYSVGSLSTLFFIFKIFCCSEAFVFLY